MEDQSLISRTSLTPADLRAVTDELVQKKLTPLQAAKRVVEGGVLLTHDAEAFFSQLLKHGGAEVANLVLDHLAMLRIGHTSTATAKYLAMQLLDYSTDPDVSRKLLAWYSDLADVSAVLEHLSIQDESDVVFYQNIVKQLCTGWGTAGVGDRLSRLLVAILKRAPQATGALVQALEDAPTEIDLREFLTELAGREEIREQVFSQLPLLGKVASPWNFLIEWIFRVYSQKRIEALTRVMEGRRTSSALLEEACLRLAKELRVEELPAFTQFMEQQKRQESWPKRIVAELLYNANLPLEALVDSQRSFALYRNIVGSLAFLFDRTSDGDTALDIKQLLTLIIQDPGFSQLDVSTYSSLLYEVSRRKGQGSLNPLRILLVERIEFTHATIFHSAFFEALRGYFIEPVHAQRILEKIVRYGKYPFHETEFLLQLLECVDQETFANFTLRYSLPLFDSPHQAERFYVLLAQTLPERFAPVYMLHRKTFKRSFAKYSEADKQIYKLCWPYLSFGQRLQSFLFG